MKRRSFLTTATGTIFGVAVTAGTGAGIAAAEGESGVAAVMYPVDDDEFEDGPEYLPGRLFDARVSKVTGNGRVIHHELPIAEGKPYIVKHGGAGRFSQRGAVINFEGPADLWPKPGRWRAVVREEVQTTKDGSFAWSVTRVDYFERPGMEYSESAIIAVGDENAVKDPDDPISGIIEDLKDEGTANPGGN